MHSVGQCSIDEYVTFSTVVIADIIMITATKQVI